VNGTSVEKAATPVITPATGRYDTAKEVTITDETEGSAIYYTTDRTIPSETNGSLYTEPFTVSTTTTVKAVAIKTGVAPSDIAVSEITIAPLEPVTILIEAEQYTGMSGVATEPCGDVGGGENVGYIDTGDWMDYTITVTAAGIYAVDYRVNGWNEAAQIQLMKDGQVLAATNAFTGNVWNTVTSDAFRLTAGTYTIKLNISGGGFNLNWMEFKMQ